MDSQISVEKRKACVRSQIKDMSVLDKTTGTLYPHVRPGDKKEGSLNSKWHVDKFVIMERVKAFWYDS